jgi:opacity protein-like surface antigen
VFVAFYFCFFQPCPVGAACHFPQGTETPGSRGSRGVLCPEGNLMKCTVITLAAAIGAAALLPSVHATENETLLRANNVLGLSLGSQHQNYREFLNGATVDSNIGDIKPSYRLYATAQRDWLGIPDLYLGASISYASGQNTYDGSLVNWVTGEQWPITDRTPTRLFDWSLRAGKAFTLNEADSIQLIPYLDYAQHRWDRLDGGGYGDYSEHYSHSVLSLGLIGQYALTDPLMLSAEAQIGRLYDASVRVRSMEGVLDFGNGYYALGADGPVILGSHNSVLFGIGADYAVTSTFHVTANYRWQRFGYGVGTNNGVQEPKSTSIMQRMDVGVALTF